MTQSEIKDVVLETLRSTNLSRPLDDQLPVAEDAIIFGPGSPLDSLGLVALLIDLEEALQSRGLLVNLSDDRAMSQVRSPFRNVHRLVDFIASL